MTEKGEEHLESVFDGYIHRLTRLNRAIEEEVECFHASQDNDLKQVSKTTIASLHEQYYKVHKDTGQFLDRHPGTFRERNEPTVTSLAMSVATNVKTVCQNEQPVDNKNVKSTRSRSSKNSYLSDSSLRSSVTKSSCGGCGGQAGVCMPRGCFEKGT